MTRPSVPNSLSAVQDMAPLTDGLRVANISFNRLAAVYPQISRSSIESFHECLKGSKRVLALCGAGLSAASGLPTFRGAGGLWRTHDATELATPQAFNWDPALVWQFYSYRRHMALSVQPNGGHRALAKLATEMKGFVTLTQNVDGLSQRAHHPRGSLHLLHGSLFDVKCSSFFCNYVEVNNFVDPIVPALALPTDDELDPTSNEAREATAARRELDISNPDIDLPEIDLRGLPHCPQCKGLLRPGVVWFGEQLPNSVLEAVEHFVDAPEKIDIIMVIGTSASVYPAAGYVDRAREKGARVCVVNLAEDLPASGMEEEDWFFQGDAAVLLPELLRPVIGDLDEVGSERL